MAEDARRSSQDVALAAAANLMHDSLEIFLIAIAEHLDAPTDHRTDFDKYFVKIDDRLKELSLSITKLPFRTHLMKLNEIRKLAKHRGIKPDRDAMTASALVSKEFLETCSDQIFLRPYWAINPLDGLEDNDKKKFLSTAYEAFELGNFSGCLSECRKYIYSTIEAQYSVEPWDIGGGSIIFGDIFFNKASYYKQNAEWVDKNVKTPFDYIQLDHSQVESELLADGFDLQTFWNIWRLTPRVIKLREFDDWLVEYRPERFESEEVGVAASYVLEQTINLALTKQRRRSEVRQHPVVQRSIKLKMSGVNIYEKATKKSKVVKITPSQITHLDVQSGTPALNDVGYFWEVVYFESQDPAKLFEGYIHGFVSEDDVQRD